MLVSEEKLAVEIGEVDSIKIDDVNLAEATKYQVFEELAANAASANHKHSSL